MPRDESADRSREQHHETDRCDHRRDHDRDLAHQADRRDDRVEGEHEVDDDDLEDNGPEGRSGPRALLVLLAFHQLMNLGGRLPKQEEPPADQDQVAAGDLLSDREQRRGEADDPGERHQQRDAHEHREAEPDAPRELALMRG
jgi:hypothetical protein